MKIRDRIKELRRVKASELIPNPMNWRKHSEQQANALRGVLAEIGYASALLARETDEGLQLIDGHLRAETTPDEEVPVLVLDVNEAEAKLLLATFDPLGAMAETDAAALDALLRDIDTGSEALQEMLAALADDASAASFNPAGLALLIAPELAIVADGHRQTQDTRDFINLYYGSFFKGGPGDKPVTKYKLICQGPSEKVVGLHMIGEAQHKLSRLSHIQNPNLNCGI